MKHVNPAIRLSAFRQQRQFLRYPHGRKDLLKMATDSQITANRQNAQSSTGAALKPAKPPLHATP
jgi:hypothetical protein